MFQNWPSPGAAAQVRAGSAPWYATPEARHIAAFLAGMAGRGLSFLYKLPDGVPVSWQLIRGAAVAQPEVCAPHPPYPKP